MRRETLIIAGAIVVIAALAIYFYFYGKKQGWWAEITELNDKPTPPTEPSPFPPEVVDPGEFPPGVTMPPEAPKVTVGVAWNLVGVLSCENILASPKHYEFPAGSIQRAAICLDDSDPFPRKFVLKLYIGDKRFWESPEVGEFVARKYTYMPKETGTYTVKAEVFSNGILLGTLYPGTITIV